jgi:hypothetical protein
MKSITLAALGFLTPAFVVAATPYSAALAAPQSDWKKSEAIYEVPVPESLKDFAFFEISDVRVRTKNGVEEVKYNLPLELTGIPNRIRLQEQADGTYSGPLAEGTCNDGTCNLKYRNLKFDEQAVRDLLTNRGVEGLELDRRMEVFAKFSGDPAGIIHRKK